MFFENRPFSFEWASCRKIIPKIIEKWSRNGAKNHKKSIKKSVRKRMRKMSRKWSQNAPQNGAKTKPTRAFYKTCFQKLLQRPPRPSKSTKNELKMLPKWGQNELQGAQMEPKWSPTEGKSRYISGTCPRDLPDHQQIPKMSSKWSQNELQEHPQLKYW